MKPFANREVAGQMLGEKLKSQSWKDAIVLALPRGGVPLAREVAIALHLPWDILLVKKIGAPSQPEYAIGAVGEDEHVIWNAESVEEMGLSESERRELVSQVQQKIHKQLERWRPLHAALKVQGCTVILVDDGLATGMTMKAAVELLRRRGAKKIVLAVPVASRSAAELLKPEVDQMVVLRIPDSFMSVGQWYENFGQVTDDEVTQLISEKMDEKSYTEAVQIPVANAFLKGVLDIPKNPTGLVIFVHGSGSSHKSPRNRLVAHAMNKSHFATLLFDLLTAEEGEDRENVFDIELLSERLKFVTGWARKQPSLQSLPIGYFGASTGAAASLVAASSDPGVRSVVSRGGRPDLAGNALNNVKCPVLLIVGGEDFDVIELNEEAKVHLQSCKMVLVPNATHLFEEAGTLEEVITLAAEWFAETLNRKNASSQTV